MLEIMIGTLGIIASVIMGVAGWFLGARNERNKIQLDMIMNLYPPLIEDLRQSTSHCNYSFATSYGFIDRDAWDMLERYFSDGSIKAIEGYDKPLYNDLYKLRNEIIPFVNGFEKRRRDMVPVIIDEWKELLYNTSTTIKKLELAQQISSNLIWEIWRDNWVESLKRYNILIEEKLKESKYLHTPPEESTFKKL